MKPIAFALFLFFACSQTQKTTSPTAEKPASSVSEKEKRVVVGAERLDILLPMLEGKRVALCVNQTSMIGKTFLADSLFKLKVNLTKFFAAEHGIRGDVEAGVFLRDQRDPTTNLPIESLYGVKKKPSFYDLQDVDVVVFDMQDVGARFYTYLSTLLYVMEGCAENNRQVIVLDRPNPNGNYVDGPILDINTQKSFVGVAPLPIVHGCTFGELASMINGEKWLRRNKVCQMTVVPCLNYDHKTMYEPPLAPSPNLPNLRSILLYPSLCLFEGTSVSVGRGTEKPFQVVGHPFAEGQFCFTPQPNAGAKDPLHNGKKCCGEDLSSLKIKELWEKRRLDLSWLFSMKTQLEGRAKFFNDDDFFDKLAGTKELRKQILAGKTEAEIRETWQPALADYLEMRKKYLLYADF